MSFEQLACEYGKELNEQLALAGMAAGFLSGGGYGGENRGNTRWSKEIRKTPGADGSTSAHWKEQYGSDTVSILHQVRNPSGRIIHQHQSHIGKYGGVYRFPNEWIQYPDIPLQ